MFSTSTDDVEAVARGSEMAGGGEALDGLFDAIVAIADLGAALQAGELVAVVVEARRHVNEISPGVECDFMIEKQFQASDDSRPAHDTFQMPN
jgi:hypothetical protein